MTPPDDASLHSLLPLARSFAEAAKAEKTIDKIRKGKLAQDELRAAAGFYVPLDRGSRDNRPVESRPQRDVMAAAVDALSSGDIDYPDRMVTDYTEPQVLSLLDAGLPRDITADTGWGPRTLLGFAALADHREVAERLLAEGADSNALTTKYTSGDSRPFRQREGGELAHPLRPIDFAWAGGSPAMRELLLKHGATETDPATTDAAFDRAFGTALWDGLFRRLRMSALPHSPIKIPKKPGPATDARLCSRFGGVPNLDPGAWPQHEGAPMLFVGQVHLPELKKPALPLPKTGLLSFFVSAGHHAKGRVVFTEEPTDGVAEGPTLLKGSYPMKFKRPKLNQFPMASNHYYEVIGRQSLENAESNPYVTRDFQTVEGRGGHQIGGHPFQIQADPRPLYAKSRPGTDVNAIVPLLQVDQFARSEGMVWGDNGIGHFFCDIEALRDGRFEEAWFDWACF